MAGSIRDRSLMGNWAVIVIFGIFVALVAVIIARSGKRTTKW